MNTSAQSGSSASFYNASPFACHLQQNSELESRVKSSNPKTSRDKNASESFCSQQEKCSAAASCKFSAPPTMPLPISASKMEVAESSPTARFPHSKSEDEEVVTQSTTESPLSVPFATASVVPPAREQGGVDRRGKPLPSSSLTIKVRAIILGWKAGTLIGRQGLVISNLRNESRCKITISDALAASDRILTIVGPSVQVALVLRRVCHLLSGVSTTGASSSTLPDHDGVSAQITPQAQRGTAPHLEDSSDAAHLRSSNNVTENPFLNFSLAVPSPLCGCLIGRGGSQIREFRQTYSVNFVVASTSIEDTHDRLVTVSGPTTNVADCLQDVCRIFASVIPGGARRRGVNDRCAPPPDSDAYEMQGNAVLVQPGWRRDGATDVPPRFPRFRSTSPAESGKKNVAKSQRASSQKSKVKSATQNQTTAAHDDGRCAENDETLCTAPRGDGPSAGATSSGDTSHRFPDCCACESGASPDHVQTNNPSNTIVECSFTLRSGETEVYLLVPNDIVGCIIGKGGKTISEIRDTSATFISITESSFPPVPPRNAISTDSYPSRTAVQRIVANGMRPGARRRDRVICIRGALQNVRTARFLMGSSILNAQTANSSGAECLLSGPCGGAATASASMKALPVGSGKA